MRILFITNRFPGLQRRGDQLRAFQQILHLSRDHAITLLSFEVADTAAPVYQQLAACCERVEMVKRNRVGMLWRALRALPGRQPLQVALYDHVPASAGLQALLADGNFDLAHVQLARLGPLVAQLAPLPVVLDLVDALSLNMGRRAELDRGPLASIARRESSRLLQYERQLVQQATLTTICAAPDRAAIGDVPQLRLLRNGVDLAQFPYAPPGDRGHSLVFVGNLGYFPNIDGVLWFAEQVMPLLLQRFPDATLRLVGARPAKALQQLAQRNNAIELVGPVDSVVPALHQAAIAIAPLRAGSGQQLKILEAMAAGTPVVASEVSAAGLEAVAGDHLLTANDAVAMADAIAALWTGPAQALTQSKAARALVEDGYSWQASAMVLEKIWREAAQRTAASSAVTDTNQC